MIESPKTWFQFPISQWGSSYCPISLLLFNWNSSRKKLYRWYLSMLFNLLGCQAKEVAESILYTLCFYLFTQSKRLFSNLEPQMWFMIKLASPVLSHLWTLEGNCYLPLMLIARNLILPGSWKILSCFPFSHILCLPTSPPPVLSIAFSCWLA